MILANLVIETEVVRLVAILTLSHLAVFLFAGSSLDVLDSLLLVRDDSTIVNLDSFVHYSARMVAVVHVVVTLFIIRIVLFCLPFVSNSARLGTCIRDLLLPENPWHSQLSSDTTSVPILLRLILLGGNICQLGLGNLDLSRGHCIKETYSGRVV
jgi:hypothetical protein